MIHVNELNVCRNGKSICSVPDLEIAIGERLAMVGSNGSGKTTLLRVLGGLESSFDGRCDVRVPNQERVFVHQSPYLFRGTVLSNVIYGPRAHGVSRRESEQDARYWLHQLGLQNRESDRVNYLSGGETRRVALARALILRPRLLLLDEPLADLDEAGAAAVVTALNQLPESTIVIASPNPLPAGLTSRDYRMTTPVTTRESS